MNTIFLLLSLTLVTTCYSQYTGSITLGPTTTIPPPICNSSGIFCKECSTVIYCQAGKPDPILEQPCAKGEICDQSKFQCVKPSTYPPCSPIEHLSFLCGSSGIFPNPGNCKKYHFCVPDGNGGYQEFEAECEGNYGYNPKTTFCDKKLSVDGCSSYPVPLCTNYGTMGAVKDNPSLYYTCVPHPDNPLIAYPLINACPHGGTWSFTKGCPNTF